MIQFLEACLLGVVEGLTEFIPVSSTGHLVLLVNILGFKAPPGKAFEIVIQLGAILAVCWLFRQKLFDVVINLPKDKEARRFSWMILLAFIPAAVVGVFAHDLITTRLFSPLVVSVSLVIGGLMILLVERMALCARYDNLERIPLPTAFMVGCMQTLAMIPGVSRSGATIMGALIFKVERKTAAEFSFFLAIPTMLGAAGYSVYKNAHAFTAHDLPLISVGFISAFIAARFIVSKAIAFIGSHGFAPFAYYRIVVGSLMLLMLWR